MTENKNFMEFFEYFKKYFNLIKNKQFKEINNPIEVTGFGGDDRLLVSFHYYKDQNIEHQKYYQLKLYYRNKLYLFCSFAIEDKRNILTQFQITDIYLKNSRGFYNRVNSLLKSDFFETEFKTKELKYDKMSGFGFVPAGIHFRSCSGGDYNNYTNTLEYDGFIGFAWEHILNER